MKLKKKLYTIVLSAALLLSIGSVGAVTAFAHDYGDSTYDFGFSPSTSTQYTPTRLKEDNTSSYMKLKEIGGYDSYPSYTASVVDGDKTNFSKTWYYTFNSSDLNQGRYLLNRAYEDQGGRMFV